MMKIKMIIFINIFIYIGKIITASAALSSSNWIVYRRGHVGIFVMCLKNYKESISRCLYPNDRFLHDAFEVSQAAMVFSTIHIVVWICHLILTVQFFWRAYRLLWSDSPLMILCYRYCTRAIIATIISVVCFIIMLILISHEKPKYLERSSKAVFGWAVYAYIVALILDVAATGMFAVKLLSQEEVVNEE